MKLLSWLRRRPAAPRAEDYPPGPVRDLVAALPPVADTPLADTPVADVDLVALDLETTGLDPTTDHVLSVGWVHVVGGEIRLGTAREVLVAPPEGADVAASATIHGLTDDEVARADPLDQVLPRVLEELRGRVLVAHHAPMETGFLAAAAARVWGCDLPLVTIDTLQVQHSLVRDSHGEVPAGALRLDAARSRFGLPRYRSHSAGLDALAAAELLLAQAGEIGHRRRRPATLRDLGARLAR